MSACCPRCSSCPGNSHSYKQRSSPSSPAAPAVDTCCQVCSCARRHELPPVRSSRSPVSCSRSCRQTPGEPRSAQPQHQEQPKATPNAASTTCFPASAASVRAPPRSWRETTTARSSLPGCGGSHHPRSQASRRSVTTTRAPSPGRAQVPRPIRPFPGGGCRPSPARRFQGPELLAPGWGLSGSEGVGLGGLGEVRPALLHGQLGGQTARVVPVASPCYPPRAGLAGWRTGRREHVGWRLLSERLLA